MEYEITTTKIEDLVVCMQNAAEGLLKGDSFDAGENESYAHALQEAANAIKDAQVPDGSTFKFCCSADFLGGAKLFVILSAIELEVFSIFLDGFRSPGSIGKCESYALRYILLPTLEFVKRVKKASG